MKPFLLTLLLLLTPLALAQESKQETKPEQKLVTDVTAPIQDLFDAMREHKGTKLSAQFTDSALLQRAEKDGSIRTTDIDKFAQAIEKSQSYLDEQLLAVHVQQSGNLASVWTPYVFYRDKAVSHCGVNSFQLVQTPAGWKIQYLIDNVFDGDCQDFITQM